MDEQNTHGATEKAKDEAAYANWRKEKRGEPLALAPLRGGESEFDWGNFVGIPASQQACFCSVDTFRLPGFRVRASGWISPQEFSALGYFSRIAPANLLRFA